MTLLDTPLDTASEPQARRPRRLRWFLVAAAAVVVAGGSLGGVYLAERGNVTALRCACVLVWSRPSGQTERYVTAGPETAIEVTGVPGHAVTFDVLVGNYAHVPQTILGLVSGDLKLSGQPVRLQIAPARGSLGADGGSPPAHGFVSGPVSLPPDDVRWLRYTIHLSPHSAWVGPGAEEAYWTSLDLRVRVDGVTKDETVDFGNDAMAVTAPPKAR